MPTTAAANNAAAPDWAAYDALISEIRTETDSAAREAKMHEAEEMLMATGAVLPIYYYNDLYLERTGIEGDYATVFGTKYFMYAKKDGAPFTNLPNLLSAALTASALIYFLVTLYAPPVLSIDDILSKGHTLSFAFPIILSPEIIPIISERLSIEVILWSPSTK